LKHSWIAKIEKSEKLETIFFGSCSEGVLYMSLTNRILLAAAILLLDLVVFFFPLTASFLAYIIIFNPPWFREFINHLDPAKKT
jgi:hypothetical protein